MENGYDFYREKPVREFDVNQTIYSLTKEVNKDNKDLTAIEYFGTKISYGELEKNTQRLADAYRKAGIKEGDTVALLLVNVPAVQENWRALSALGATSKWIDVRNKEKDLIEKLNENKCKYAVVFDGIAQNVIDVLNETDIEKVLVVSPKDYLNPIIKVLASLKKDEDSVEIPKIEYNDKIMKYKDFLKTGNVDSNFEPVKFEKERPSLIIQSSGSTGKSKSIVHTEYNINSEMLKEAYSDLPFAVGKKMHVSVPPFIIYGLCNSTYAAMAFSMTAVMTPYVRAQAIYDDLGKFDFACGAPFHFRYIYDKIITLRSKIDELSKEKSPKAKKELLKTAKELAKLMEKLDRVKVFISGGDKIAPKELLAMEQDFRVPIINGYGNNEMCGAAIVSPMYAVKPESAGVPYKGVEIHAFDPDTNEQLPDGESGELCMSSDSIFVEYVNNPEETKRIKQKHSDGKYWVHTGDIGYIDEDGYVFITGRNKRLIKMDGFKIAPEVIESAILNDETITDCVVVKVPDKDHVEVPMAYIKRPENTTLSDDYIIELAINACTKYLPEYEKPAYFQVVDEIPYKNGKHDFGTLENMGREYVESLENGLKRTLV